MWIHCSLCMQNKETNWIGVTNKQCIQFSNNEFCNRIYGDLNLFLGRFMYIFLNHPLNSKRSRKWENVLFLFQVFFFSETSYGLDSTVIHYGHVWFQGTINSPQKFSLSQVVRFPSAWAWHRERLFSQK